MAKWSRQYRQCRAKRYSARSRHRKLTVKCCDKCEIEVSTVREEGQRERMGTYTLDEGGLSRSSVSDCRAKVRFPRKEVERLDEESSELCKGEDHARGNDSQVGV